MERKNNKKYVLLILIIFILIIAVGLYITNNIGKTATDKSYERAERSLSSLLKRISVSDVTAQKATITDDSNLAEELPDIDKYSFVVDGKGDINIEIVSSTEKSGTGVDGWLTEVARNFNSEKLKIGEQTVSVSIRSIASGLATDYIISGKYTPDAYTPSNELWIEMIKSKNIKVTQKSDKLVGNVAGIVLEKDKYNNIQQKYGEVTLDTIIKACLSGEIVMGYTNPYASSAGMNFLISTLAYYDSENPTSEKAIEGFKKVQEKIPFVSYTTLQMRDSAEKGSLDAFILEYQTFINDTELSNKYVFCPYGVVHDNPIYTIGTVSDEKEKGLELFIQYCQKQSSQSLAKEYGFNKYENYASDTKVYDGNILFEAQDIWKEEKDLGNPVIGVFVADISGSMNGTPLSELKSSLINASKYINNNNYVGLVSYNNNVYRNLPIEEFDLNQRAYFNGAVQSLKATGGTATYDAILVAIDMIQSKLKEVPSAKPMIFVLSDGETNRGNSLEEITNIVEGFQIPIYTIGYNADLDELNKISSINEAASINADSDDVVYQLKNLFNSNL